MSIFVKLFGLDTELQRDETSSGPKRTKNANQIKPRQSYVYAHLDPMGRVFYVGKGIGRRAWATDTKRRHYYWHRYVEDHLGGEYSIEILNDNLINEEAEYLEQEWIAHFGEQLINWVNMARHDDWDAIELLHKNQNANRELLVQARKYESTDLEKATELYIDAVEAIASYAYVNYTSGLLGQVMEEDMKKRGVGGEISAIDRLSMCLIKLGRVDDAAERTANYFSAFKRDSMLKQADRIHKRVNKAVAKNRKGIIETG